MHLIVNVSWLLVPPLYGKRDPYMLVDAGRRIEWQLHIHGHSLGVFTLLECYHTMYYVMYTVCTSIYVVCTCMLNSDDGLMFTNERVMCKCVMCIYVNTYVQVYSAYYL